MIEFNSSNILPASLKKRIKWTPHGRIEKKTHLERLALPFFGAALVPALPASAGFLSFEDDELDEDDRDRERLDT